jgi:hypothetical protein
MSNPKYEALLSNIHKKLEAAKLQNQPDIVLDMLLELCPVGECAICARIICPHNDLFHFHHDGCPSCAEHEGDSL